MKRILALVLLAALFTAPAWAEQTTVTNAGELESALDNELFDTINIAPGTYGGRFTVGRDVKLIGSGSSKPILDGGALGSVLTIRGAKVTLQNLIVQNGKAQYGAAVYVGGGADVTAAGCTFRNNRPSSTSDYFGPHGAVYVGSGSCSITLENCDFTGNTAVACDGVGFYSCGTAVLTNCSFTNNTNLSESGRDDEGHPYSLRSDGAAYFEGGTATLTDCSFTNNRCEGRTAGVYLDGVAEATVQGCEFKNNTGGKGAALGISSLCGNVTVKDCDFTGNKIIEEELSGGNLWGGAVWCLSGQLFVNCAFVDNGGENCEQGGGIYFSSDGGNSTLINCLFTGNSAVNLGDEEYYPKGKGGAYYVDGEHDRKLTFIHCTLVGNSANYGAEIFYDGVPERFVNCVIWHDGDTAYRPWTWAEPDEPPVTFDSCAVSSSILTTENAFDNGCAFIKNRGSKPVSGGTPVRVTYTRPNGHSVEVVQTSGVELENASDSLTGRSLSAIAGEYEVEQELLNTDLTARERSASAPELGAVNPGDVNPPAPPQVTPPVITSFQVGGFDGSTGLSMVAGRTY
ncbi:MAG: right-handed parallel beta-helix repeat-containing protein, partial [Synergistes sp.]|nr:right-handed parallel beta-helix repeat-containing protein [Synergistes sp.]